MTISKTYPFDRDFLTSFFSFLRSKIVELEEELRVVGNNLKSLEVSEEKVRTQFPRYKKQQESISVHAIFIHLDNKKIRIDAMQRRSRFCLHQCVTCHCVRRK